jgi:hypothetical protein
MGCGCVFNLENKLLELGLRSSKSRNQAVRDPFVMDLTPVVVPLIHLKLSLQRVTSWQHSLAPLSA